MQKIAKAAETAALHTEKREENENVKNSSLFILKVKYEEIKGIIIKKVLSSTKNVLLYIFQKYCYNIKMTSTIYGGAYAG